MPRPANRQTPRQATTVTLPADLLAQARAFGLNVSQACEPGLKTELARARAARWIEGNGDAI